MNWKKNAIFILSIFVCCIPLFLTFNRGINYFDEGYMLEAARRIIAGELPYRDFHFIYTPATVYFLAFVLRLGGQYIIVERLAAASLSVVGIIFLGLLTRKLTKNSIFTFLSMFLYVLWGPAHINFYWPVMCVLPLIFMYLYLLLGSHLFFAGIVAATTLLCKQNFGAAIMISFLLYLFWAKYSKRQILMFGLGFLSVMAVFFTHLLATQSLIPFFTDMNAYTIQGILIRQDLSVPFPTQSIGKFLLYTFPGIFSFIIGIGLIVQKKNSTLLFIPFTLLGVYLFGIFPTPDWTHLLPLISMIGILFVLLIHILGVKYRFFSYVFMVCAIGVGMYSLLVRNYYRWEGPLIKHTHCFSSGRMKGICIDGKNYSVVSQTLAQIEKETSKDVYIFSSYHNSIYYFLTQKNNPTREIESPIGEKEEAKAINDLRQKKVAIIITRFPLNAHQSRKIADYIEKNYVPIYTVFEFTVWKKKS